MACCCGQGVGRMKTFLTIHRDVLMVFVAFVELLVATGPPYAYSVLFTSLQEEFQSGAVTTGWVGSLANTLVFINPLSTLLIRRFGPRAVTLLGACLLSGGLVATSFVPSLTYAFATFGIIVGFGSSFVYQSGVTVVYDWFPAKNCSRATAAAIMGTSVGVLVFAPLLRTLITAYGWRNSLRIISGACFVASVCPGVFITTPAMIDTDEALKEKSAGDVDSSHERSSSVGAVGKVDTECQVDAVSQSDQASQVDIDSHVDTNDVDKLSIRMSSEADADVDTEEYSSTGALRPSLIEALKEVDTWVWFFGFFLSNLALTFIMINYPSFLEYDLNFSPDEITVTLILSAIGEILGKALFSGVGDSLPCLKLYVMAATGLLMAVVCGLMIILRTVPLMYMLASILGPIRGVSYVSPYPSSMEIFGKFGSDRVVTFTLMPIGLAFLVGVVLTGGLFDLTGDYTLTLVCVSVILVISSVILLIIPARMRLRSASCCKSGAIETTKTPVDNPALELSTYL